MFSRIRKSIADKDQGFTLIELLVVIIIIGILAAIAIPVFLNQRKKGVDASIKHDLKNMATMMETHFVDNPTAAALTFNVAAGSSAAVGTNTFKASPGNWVIVVPITTLGVDRGYCIKAGNAGSTRGIDPDPAHYNYNAHLFFYDSTQGGLTITAC